MESLQDGTFDHLVTEAEERAGRPVVVGVDASNVEVPTGRGDVRSAVRELAEGRRDVLRFESSQGRLRCVRSEAPLGILRGREKVTGLSELASGMGLIENLDWIWVDFQVGLPFLVGATGPEADVWSDEQVWTRACSPWRSWLR
jgi:hypothetical protein